MSHELLRDPKLFTTLLRFDKDLAVQTQAGGCPCGGRLHRANYPRKPRGTPAEETEAAFSMRFSFCCAQDCCRKRTTPPSVRFLGRRVYLAALVVLVTTMRHGLKPVRLRTLREWFGVRAATLRRWRSWWTEIFVTTPVWKALCGRLMPSIDMAQLPESWLQRVEGSSELDRLLRLLAWLLPLTTQTPGKGAEILRAV